MFKTIQNGPYDLNKQNYFDLILINPRLTHTHIKWFLINNIVLHCNFCILNVTQTRMTFLSAPIALLTSKKRRL